MIDASPEAVPFYDRVRAGLTEASTLLSETGRSRSFANYLDLVSEVSSLHADYVLYLGAGVTLSAKSEEAVVGAAPFRPADWRQLLQQLFEQATAHTGSRRRILEEWCDRVGASPGKTDAESFERVAAVMDRLQLAWFIGRLFNPGERDDCIRRIVEPRQPVHSRLLEQVARLPTSAIVTTNYDSTAQSHLDRYLQGLRPTNTINVPADPPRRYDGPVFAVYDNDSLSRSFREGGLHLFYLHGAARVPGCPLVLDRFDYANLMATRDGLFDYVTYLLRSRPAVYIGFSLDDPSFNFIENRLFVADRLQRPRSYAFVRHASETEHEWWASRNLQLIEYRDHQSLPQLVQVVADTRAFLCWAEPTRPSNTYRNEDRTDSYLTGSLSAYSSSDYARAVSNARAALASTLLWGTMEADLPLDLGVEHPLRILDVRIRLGLSHYKMRYSDPQQRERIGINVRSADAIIKTLETHLPFQGPSSPSDSHAARRARIYRSALLVLKGRVAYSEGEWASARSLYERVCSELGSTATDAFGLDAPCYRPTDPTDYDTLRALEVYSYAKCQLSRIEYQWTGDRTLRAQPAEVEALCELSRRLLWISGTVAETPPTPLVAYFRNSLGTLGCVAKWFAGRLLVGAFADVVPTRVERAADCVAKLDSAIALLSDRGDVEGEVSARWRGLRARYLARAYCLRWFIRVLAPQNQVREEIRDDLQNAYGELCTAMQLVRRPQHERDFVLAHLEMSRISIVALFGTVLRRQSADGHVELEWGVTTTLHHLTVAYTLLEDFVSDNDAVFLKSIAVRLLGYVKLLDDFFDLRLVDPPQIARIAGFLSPQEALAHCLEQLDPQYSEQRTGHFAQSIEALRLELATRFRKP